MTKTVKTMKQMATQDSYCPKVAIPNTNWELHCKSFGNEKNDGVNSTTIYCRNFYTCHNVPSVTQ
jgi:hypothetical protein